MSKTAFIFPGQGAQYVGMGQDFYDKMPVCRQVIEKASQVSGLDLPKICFTENEEIHITEYTQIAMLSVEAAILKALEQEGLMPDVSAGLSLGEYGACIASGVLFGGCLLCGKEKGNLHAGGSARRRRHVRGYGHRRRGHRKACRETEGIVSIANYNCPGQIVITGEEGAVAKASEKLKELGARRIVPLNVSGPFHSAMLAGAGEKLAEVLQSVAVGEPKIPYATNVTAEYVTKASQVKELLVRQVSSSVKWQQCVEKMIADGVDTFVEIGPGKTLSGFMRKISRDVKMLNIQTVEDFEKAVETLKNQTADRE
ncbi:MAG: ACP S-malonyltransferase [Blautia marasmi]